MPIFPSQIAEAEEVIGGPLQVTRFAATFGLAFFAIAVAAVSVVLYPIVPALRFNSWLMASMLFTTIWFALSARFLLCPPNPKELVLIWAPVAKFVLLGSSLVTASTIWLFFPYANTQLQLVMLVFYMGFVPTQILCSPENTATNRLGIICVLGSITVYFGLKGDLLSITLAVFVTMFSVVMFFACEVVKTATENAHAMRLASEKSAAALEIALKQVAAERDAKTQFIASASHDLAQPLLAAKLFFSQALRATTDANRLRATKFAEQAFLSGEQLLTHMLTYLKLEANEVNPTISPVSVNPILARLVTQFEPAAELAALKIRWVPTRLTVMADTALLERALGNLMHNAIVHSGAKKVLIGLRRHSNGAIRIWVMDNGSGINPEEANLLFNDFTRGSSSTQSKSGFGLGLASVRRTALLFAGNAGVVPFASNGAAFYIELPEGQATKLPAIESLQYSVHETSKLLPEYANLPHLR